MPWIKREVCTGCGRCIQACHIEGAIFLVEEKAIIDPSKCISCDRCVEACPVGAIQGSADAVEPQAIQYVEVHPESAVQQQNTLSKPDSDAMVSAPKARRWPAIAGGIASTAVGVAATVGEALLSKWLEGSGGKSGSIGSGTAIRQGRRGGRGKRRRGGRT